MRHPLEVLHVPYRWRLYYPHTWLLSQFGHWEYEHEYKECPSGERFCVHPHYRLGRAK